MKVEEKRKVEKQTKKLNFKQETIAQKVGISRQHYNAILNGKRKPSVNLAKQLGSVLKLDWTIFFTD